MPTITPQTAPTLTVHQTATRGWIAHLAWSPDGKLLACSSAGGVGLWRGSIAGKQLFIKGHGGPVKGVAFAPNGTTLATCSADTTVKTWDLRAFSPQMQPINTYTTPHAVEKVVFARNNTIITCGVDGMLRFFPTAAATPAHTDEANTLALSPDHRLLATGGRDHLARLWDTGTHEPLADLRGHTDWVRAVAFHPSEPLLVTASRDRSARVWDISTPAAPQLRYALAHRGDVRTAAFSADGAVLATGSTDAAIQLWETASGDHLGALAGHTMPVMALAFHPGGALLASGGGDNQVMLWG
jgi:WD40 repeat protein